VSAQIPTTDTLPTGAPQQWSPISTTLISGAVPRVKGDTWPQSTFTKLPL
jgi:hypothetical protein